jgi:Phage integrase SAM-like domain/Arm DNA-binding domain
MNLNQTFSILFWLNKGKGNARGFAPIWVRITIDGKRAESSLKRQIPIEHWDNENGKASKSCADGDMINQHLIMVQAEITRHYNILLTTKDYVTAEDVKKSYWGIKEPKKTFIQLFDQYIQHLHEKKEIGEISEGRYKRFEILRGKCVSFIKSKLSKTDMLLEDTKLSFIAEFQHYMRTVELIGHNTAMKYAKDLKQILKYGVTLEYIMVSPFSNFKCSFKNVKRDFLDQNELDIMYNKKLMIDRLAEVRDCFIFSCYTGFAYSDAESLGPDDVVFGIDGDKWIAN